MPSIFTLNHHHGSCPSSSPTVKVHASYLHSTATATTTTTTNNTNTNTNMRRHYVPRVLPLPLTCYCLWCSCFMQFLLASRHSCFTPILLLWGLICLLHAVPALMGQCCACAVCGDAALPSKCCNGNVFLAEQASLLLLYNIVLRLFSNKWWNSCSSGNLAVR